MMTPKGKKMVSPELLRVIGNKGPRIQREKYKVTLVRFGEHRIPHGRKHRVMTGLRIHTAKGIKIVLETNVTLSVDSFENEEFKALTVRFSGTALHRADREKRTRLLGILATQCGKDAITKGYVHLTEENILRIWCEEIPDEGIFVHLDVCNDSDI